MLYIYDIYYMCVLVEFLLLARVLVFFGFLSLKKNRDKYFL